VAEVMGWTKARGRMNVSSAMIDWIFSANWGGTV
jgi:hypothetical protein